ERYFALHWVLPAFFCIMQCADGVCQQPCIQQKSRLGLGGLPSRSLAADGGARGSRTPDLVNAIHALSQLSYGPNSRVQLPLLGSSSCNQFSSSFSTPSPMMSLTSALPSSSSSMKAASSRLSSISTSSSPSPAAAPSAAAGFFLPCCSASASSSETN